VLWEVSSSAVRGAGQPGAARKVATSSQLGKRLGRTGGKGGRTEWPLEREPVSLVTASWYPWARWWYGGRLGGA